MTDADIELNIYRILSGVLYFYFKAKLGNNFQKTMEYPKEISDELDWQLLLAIHQLYMQ